MRESFNPSVRAMATSVMPAARTLRTAKAVGREIE
jgi:hypothetical protein